MIRPPLVPVAQIGLFSVVLDVALVPVTTPVVLARDREALGIGIDGVPKDGRIPGRQGYTASNGVAGRAEGPDRHADPAQADHERADPPDEFPAARSIEGGKAGEVREFGGIEMVWCPPGTFLMGSPENEKYRRDDETRHEVTLTRGFWLAKTECTQGQWESVMGMDVRELSKRKSIGSITEVGRDFPVYFVSWEDATDWMGEMNERHPLPEGWKWSLPTEAQWEYACRAGTDGPFAGEVDEMAWHSGNSMLTTHEVEKKEPNPWGLYDMHGSLWEWCSDLYGPYPEKAVTDPVVLTGGPNRVRRGGCWCTSWRNARSANRDSYSGGFRVDGVGFRPAVVFVR